MIRLLVEKVLNLLWKIHSSLDFSTTNSTSGSICDRLFLVGGIADSEVAAITSWFRSSLKFFSQDCGGGSGRRPLWVGWRVRRSMLRRLDRPVAAGSWAHLKVSPAFFEAGRRRLDLYAGPRYSSNNQSLPSPPPIVLCDPNSSFTCSGQVKLQCFWHGCCLFFIISTNYHSKVVVVMHYHAAMLLL